MKNSFCIGGVLFAAIVLSSLQARSAGLYFADRGARALGRAGAFVAGGDDLGAVSYNIAGIYDAGSQVLVDLSWLHFTSDYTRRAIVDQVDPNTGEVTGQYTQTFPAVHGTSPVLPIPTIVASFQPHKQWVLEGGMWAPYSALTSYPTTVEGEAAPQRYSLLTLNGSALAVVGFGAAFAPNEQWRIGVGVGAFVGTMGIQTTLSGCVPDTFFCSPEDPDWDAVAEVVAGPIFAPTGEVGAIYIPHPHWRIGASFQFPQYIRGPAKIKTRLPSAAVFENASVEGEDAEVAFDMPWNALIGVETRVVDNLRFEVGAGYQRWSMHDQIQFKTNGISLKNVSGFSENYYIPDMTEIRGFQDSFSVRMGGEYAFQLWGYPWDIRSGVSYESSAIPKEYLSVLTVDMDKVTAAGGLSLHINKWRFDMTYAHVFGMDVDVDPTEAKIPQKSPLSANGTNNDIVNAGYYSARADVWSIGFTYTFEPPPKEYQPK